MTDKTQPDTQYSPYDVYNYDPKLIGNSWDDIEVGYTYTAFPDHCRVLSQELVTAFADVTGDFNPIHLDEKFARRSIHRSKIAHGAFMMSFTIGQYHGSGYTYGTTLALLGIDVKFLMACKIGDEVYTEFTVIEKEENPHPKRGKVKFRSWLRRASDHEKYLEVEFSVLIRRLKGKSVLKRLGVE